MKTLSQRYQKWLPVCLLCLVVAFSHAGCTPLKKKFIRQKKKDKDAVSDFVPVLEPEVYPVKTTTPADEYARQYALLDVWISDFADNFTTVDNDKRMVSDVDTALKAADEMAALLKSPAADDLEAIKKQLVFLRGEYGKPASFRNVSRMTSELRDIDRNLRKKLKPVAVAGSLKD